MARGRKNGCPVSVADWLIYIMDKSQLEETWVRIYGLTSMTRTISGETEDSSADTDVWSEPYITKRSGTIDLEGVKKVVEATGEIDRGQELLDDYGRFIFTVKQHPEDFDLKRIQQRIFLRILL